MGARGLYPFLKPSSCGDLQKGTVVMDSSFPSAYEAIIDKTKGLSVRTFMLANAVVGTTTAPAAVRA